MQTKWQMQWPNGRTTYGPLPVRSRPKGDTGPFLEIAVERRGYAIMAHMTRLLEEAIAKVRELPEEEQNRAAGFLLDFATPNAPGYHLTAEQLAEVRRRRAVKNPKTITLPELDKRLHRLGVSGSWSATRPSTISQQFSCGY